MIRSFRHRALRNLYNGRGGSRLPPEQVEKLTDILATLDYSRAPNNMDLPGYRLHRLRGRLSGHYAVSVSGNWRVTFRFEDGDVFDVDYVDYH